MTCKGGNPLSSDAVRRNSAVTSAEAAEGALRALMRAALRANEVARLTGTNLIVLREGKIVRVAPRGVEL